MNQKEKGFSLIEVLVVLGIIGLFTTFLTPKISNYLALGKETKVIATLNSLRTASEMYNLENGSGLGKDKLDGNLTKADVEKLKEYISNGYKDLIKNLLNDYEEVLYEIGGSKDENNEVIYGGQVKFTFEAPKGEKSDGIKIWILPIDGVREYNLKGTKWKEL